ncbi:MAG: hypothetical protein NWF05_07570 [Candidatus Bathyarchaeota archaeon]|nr:hypothetical protein [Candidatus Bathyarchaeota archaeon]
MVQLGCTEIQAKIYISLIQLKVAKAKTISDYTRVPRQEVYRILTELQEKGLVEKIICAPTKYKATPVEHGLPRLVKQRNIELKSLQEKIEELIRKIKEANDNASNSFKEDPAQFMLISEKDAITFRIRNALENVQKSLDMMCSYSVFTQTMLLFADSHMRALKRGVKIRLIIEKNGNINPQNSEINTQPFLAHRNFKLKTVTKNLKGKFIIIDNQQIYMSAIPTGNFGEHASLWTNSGSLLEIAKDYFEHIWSTKNQKPLTAVT